MERVDYQSLIIQDLVNLDAKGELNKSPWYQRRSVWLPSQKSYLLNTIFEKKPIPALYLRHSIDLDKGISIKEVVDGQQRTRALLEFYENKFTARHPEHPKKVKFSELKNSQKESFLLTAIPIGFLLGATDSDVIDIFARINSVSKTLNSQEKRNANFSGEFKQLSVSEATARTEFWKDYKIFSANSIARMDEVQFTSDLIMNIAEPLSSYSAAKLTKYYEKHDDDFPKRDEVQKKLTRIFDTLVSIKPEVIQNTIFNRSPILFSLIISLDNIKKHSIEKIESGLIEMDLRFDSDIPVSKRAKEDIDFYNACSATTQSLENRKTRVDYITKHIS